MLILLSSPYETHHWFHSFREVQVCHVSRCGAPTRLLRILGCLFLLFFPKNLVEKFEELIRPFVVKRSLGLQLPIYGVSYRSFLLETFKDFVPHNIVFLCIVNDALGEIFEREGCDLVEIPAGEVGEFATHHWDLPLI